MTDTITVEVTAEDIRDGVLEDPCRCPLALALARATRGRYANVGSFTFSTGVAFDDYRYGELSPEAARFVNRFDSQLPVEPATFTLTFEN